MRHSVFFKSLLSTLLWVVLRSACLALRPCCHLCSSLVQPCLGQTRGLKKCCCARHPTWCTEFSSSSPKSALSYYYAFIRKNFYLARMTAWFIARGTLHFWFSISSYLYHIEKKCIAPAITFSFNVLLKKNTEAKFQCSRILLTYWRLHAVFSWIQKRGFVCFQVSVISFLSIGNFKLLPDYDLCFVLALIL